MTYDLVCVWVCLFSVLNIIIESLFLPVDIQHTTSVPADSASSVVTPGTSTALE